MSRGCRFRSAGTEPRIRRDRSNGQGPNKNGGGYLTRPPGKRACLGRCQYLHDSVWNRQGESSRRADGDYLMVSMDQWTAHYPSKADD